VKGNSAKIDFLQSKKFVIFQWSVFCVAFEMLQSGTRLKALNQ
jgi:hypothetical protein